MTIASDTIPVADKDRLDEARLTAWMEANVAGFTGPLTYAKFAGGQSNPTYRSTACADGSSVPNGLRRST